jgi:hypothetical protein
MLKKSLLWEGKESELKRFEAKLSVLVHFRRKKFNGLKTQTFNG